MVASCSLHDGHQKPRLARLGEPCHLATSSLAAAGREFASTALALTAAVGIRHQPRRRLRLAMIPWALRARLRSLEEFVQIWRRTMAPR